jgi:hypothetical protein
MFRSAPDAAIRLRDRPPEWRGVKTGSCVWGAGRGVAGKKTPGLAGPQAMIGAVQGEQFAVPAVFEDTAMVEHQDTVEVGNGGQTVRCPIPDAASCL